MSSPGSPSPLPGSPTKEAAMAVEKENTAPGTPLRDTPVNGTSKVVAHVDADPPRNPGEVVQVPSTAPPTAASVHKPDEAHKVDQMEAQHAKDAEGPLSESDSMGSESASSDLPVFNWEDLRRRYTKALQTVNQEEEDILEEFYKFSDTFSVWGGASANRDNERASKRLKTRENFVRLGEASLDKKKEHYTEVVDAFKKALEILRR